MDETKAVFVGDAIPLGIDNKSFLEAVAKSQKDNSKPLNFNAFVFEKCDWFKNIREIKNEHANPNP